MLLYTFQPAEVVEKLMRDGQHVTNSEKSIPEFNFAYDFLSNYMREKIGGVEDVKYPVWAWQKWEDEKPSIEKLGSSAGIPGQELALLTLDVPEDEVVLSDFDRWSLVICDCLLSNSEEEDDRINAEYEALPENQQEEYKRQNWRRCFDIEKVDNDWVSCGHSIQATFWVLKKEYVKNIEYFTV